MDIGLSFELNKWGLFIIISRFINDIKVFTIIGIARTLSNITITSSIRLYHANVFDRSL